MSKEELITKIEADVKILDLWHWIWPETEDTPKAYEISNTKKEKLQAKIWKRIAVSGAKLFELLEKELEDQK